MIEPRVIGPVIGLLLVLQALGMLAPAAFDWAAGHEDWPGFLASSAICGLAGGALMLTRGRSRRTPLSIRGAFVLTALVWAALPLFGALPYVFCVPEMQNVDAVFESVSALTTTGSTVMTGLDGQDRGILLWRGIQQWLGGIGVIVMAVAILPELQIGGMQLFRSESFDTFGKILPRAAQIASSISSIYVGLTVACMFAYVAAGMHGFDALVHAMTTIATGGFANSDASFGGYDDRPYIEYVAALFMLLASLPFVRYVQLVSGSARPLLRDAQVRAFLTIALVVVGVLALAAPLSGEYALRKALFNGVSILTGTGYASADYGAWGALPVMALFIAGLVGGCAGSTCCSVKVFRFQVLWAALVAQLREMASPRGVFRPRYEGRALSEEVIGSVLAFFVMFFVAIGVLTSALTLTGLDYVTALSGAATAVANVGPGFGPVIGPSGNFQPLPDAAKWMLCAGMLLGRLELFTILALFTPGFWRR